VLPAAFLTYRGYCRFTVISDLTIFHDDEAPRSFVKRFFEELEILRNTQPFSLEKSTGRQSLV
jgi:hypothetical protein